DTMRMLGFIPSALPNRKNERSASFRASITSNVVREHSGRAGAPIRGRQRRGRGARDEEHGAARARIGAPGATGTRGLELIAIESAFGRRAPKRAHSDCALSDAGRSPLLVEG